jgi:hypothetical protein
LPLVALPFLYITILAVATDKYKSKFGHLGHILCEVHHTALCGYLIVIVAILADKFQKYKSTRRKWGVN